MAPSLLIEYLAIPAPLLRGAARTGVISAYNAVSRAVLEKAFEE